MRQLNCYVSHAAVFLYIIMKTAEKFFGDFKLTQGKAANYNINVEG